MDEPTSDSLPEAYPETPGLTEAAFIAFIRLAVDKAISYWFNFDVLLNSAVKSALYSCRFFLYDSNDFAVVTDALPLKYLCHFFR